MVLSTCSGNSILNMMKRPAFVAVLAAALSLHGQSAYLVLASERGAWIGQGKAYDLVYTPKNSVFFGARVVRRLASGEPSEVDLSFGFGTESGIELTPVSMTFGTTRLGIPIRPGQYTNAHGSLILPGVPYFYFGFGGGTCGDRLVGSFEISRLVFGPGDTIKSFAATFEQRCSIGEPLTSGSIVFQSEPELPKLLVATSAAGPFVLETTAQGLAETGQFSIPLSQESRFFRIEDVRQRDITRIERVGAGVVVTFQ